MMRRAAAAALGLVIELASVAVWVMAVGRVCVVQRASGTATIAMRTKAAKARHNVETNTQISLPSAERGELPRDYQAWPGGLISTL